jgi:hypothetical protein
MAFAAGHDLDATGQNRVSPNGPTHLAFAASQPFDDDGAIVSTSEAMLTCLSVSRAVVPRLASSKEEAIFLRIRFKRGSCHAESSR